MSWLEDADSAFPRESLQRQMAKVVKETKESHVQIFGDTSFASDFAGAFEGDAKDKHGYLRGDAKTQVRTGVDARAATLSYYRSKAKAGLPGAREALAAELAFRAETAARFDAIAAAHGASASSSRASRWTSRASTDDVWLLQGCGGRRAPVVPPRHLGRVRPRPRRHAGRALRPRRAGRRGVGPLGVRLILCVP